MNQGFNYKLIVFITATIFGLFYSFPSFFDSNFGRKISLGLDLQGGMYMLLGIRSEEAVQAKIKSLAASIDFFSQKEDILIDELNFDEESVYFELLDKDEKSKLETFLNREQGVNISTDGLKYNLSFTEKEIFLIKDFALKQTIETIRNRLDLFGLSEPSVTKQGLENIVVEIPGIKTAEEEQRTRNLIAQSAHLELMAVSTARNSKASFMTQIEAKKYGEVILPDKYDSNIKYALKAVPILDGSMLKDARVAYDQNNQPVINFTLDSKGADIFGDFTAKYIGKRLAVVLDKKVYSAPVIRERIGAGNGQISGNFTIQEASDLAIALRSGALNASVYMQEKRSVGPSLGSDSIKQSAIALISGFILVAFFMIFFYKISGIISVIALLANLFIIIAIMAAFGATLTLPGMVGIVLTVGMAVDANVIINERIKEMLYFKNDLKNAIEKGYNNAFSAIFDANVTTLIAAVALYAYGTGPIKGFAITLSIGILVSMLTAILGTRGIYEHFMSKLTKSDPQKIINYKIKDDYK